ncbi:MAG: hypothetical protein JOY95_00470 [Silvibacterium sp.]|nr:hypothetical protein [Silvibacterium sp.]
MKSLAPLTFLAAMLMSAAVFAHSQVPADTGSRISQTDAQNALDFHNAKRADVKVPPLTWSTQLAAVAQRWADRLAQDEGCNLVHTKNNIYGENLFGGEGRAFTSLDASRAWYSEISKYHYGVVTESNWYPTGHYTQMVWRSTTQLGMGQATCPNGGIVIVAEYNPRGNYLGQAPY